MLKKRLSLFIHLIIIILMTSCSSTQNKEKLSFSEISIGNGGGATGFMNGFTIDTKGQVFQWNGRTIKDNLIELHTIHKDSLDIIFEIVRKSNLIDLKFEQPNNFYRLLQIKTDKKENYIVWGLNANSDTTKNLNETYEKIISIINNSK